MTSGGVQCGAQCKVCRAPPSVQRDEAGTRLLNDQLPIDDHLAVGVHDDEVRLAERFAGDHEDLAALHRDVGDRWVADHDLRRWSIKPHKRSLVDNYLDIVVCGRRALIGADGKKRAAMTNKRLTAFG